MNLQQMRRAAQREAAYQLRGSSCDEINERADEIMDGWICEARREAAERGEPEDTPCVEHCDDWGTGEGRYHGRM